MSGVFTYGVRFPRGEVVLRCEGVARLMKELRKARRWGVAVTVIDWDSF